MAQFAAVGVEKFGVTASGSGHGGEFAGLHVEDLAEKAASGPHLAGFKSSMLTFGAGIAEGHFGPFRLVTTLYTRRAWDIHFQVMNSGDSGKNDAGSDPS